MWHQMEIMKYNITLTQEEMEQISCSLQCAAGRVQTRPALDTIREALAQQSEKVWQPIETVPTETEVFIGKFIDGEFKFGRSEMFYEQANEFAGETFSGWVWSEDECSSSITESPTHWMPLPTPPKDKL